MIIFIILGFLLAIIFGAWLTVMCWFVTFNPFGDSAKWYWYLIGWCIVIGYWCLLFTNSPFSVSMSIN